MSLCLLLKHSSGSDPRISAGVDLLIRVTLISTVLRLSVTDRHVRSHGTSPEGDDGGIFFKYKCRRPERSECEGKRNGRRQ